MRYKYFTVLFIFCFYGLVNAQEQLVLELDLEQDSLSMSHNIDNFFFDATKNYAPGNDENINNMNHPALKDHLAATALVRLNGEVVGIATEQEIVYRDSGNKPVANSTWIFRLNSPGLSGFMFVEQMEDASAVARLIGEVMQYPDKIWDDEWQLFLSTDGETHVQYASGDLARFQGGLFEEYNGLNPADQKNYGRFRGKIKFIIHTPGISPQ